MDELAAWLGKHGLDDYVSLFAEQRILISDLPLLTEGDIRELNLPLGPRRRLLSALETLRELPANSVPAAPVPVAHLAREAERRQLTIMFADMVGSTELSQRLDPEDLREINRRYQDAVKVAIEEYEGFVARYMGDGVLAYYGYPRAHEDDAARAVKAGLAVVNSVSRIDLGDLSPDLAPLCVRVGIATGPVVVGDLIGAGASEEWAVVGETPNLAARVESSAPSNRVAVSPGTYELTRSYIDYERGPEVALKGISGLVQLWYAVSVRSHASRFHATRSDVQTPLSGRDEQISSLKRRWQDAVAGDGHVIMLSGEPGVGKSRLADWMANHVQSLGLPIYMLQCSPLHTTTPLYPFFSHGPGFRDIHSAGQVDKNDDAIDRLDLPRTAESFGLAFQDEGAQSKNSGASTISGVIGSLVEELVQVVSKSSTLLILEDLHWGDPSTIEAVQRFVVMAENLSVLVLLTFRPDFSPPWAGNAATSLVMLSRLGHRDARRLAQAIPAGSSLSDEQLESIVSRADGIPLFIEELLQAELLAENLQVKNSDKHRAATALDPRIPTSLVGALTARFDRSPEARETAQAASVLGREFDYHLLEQISGIDRAVLRAGLDELNNAGLVQVSGDPNNLVCRFKHALVRDAAYATLSRARRKHLHGIAAESYAKTEGLAQGGRQTEVMAYHLVEAGRETEAVRVQRKAAEVLGRVGSFGEAFQLLHQAIELVKAGRAAASNEHFVEMLVALGELAREVHGGKHRITTDIYEEATRSVTPGMPAMLRISQMRSIWRHAHGSTYYNRALEIAGEMLTISSQDENFELVGEALFCKGVTLQFMGRHRDAKDSLHEALEVYAKVSSDVRSNAVGEDVWTSCMLYSAYAEWHCGLPREAQRLLHAAIERSSRQSKPYAQAMAFSFASHVDFLCGDEEGMFRHATAAANVFEATIRTRYRPFAQIHLGWLMAKGGDHSGVELISSARRQWLDENGQSINAHHLWVTMHADALRLLGRNQEGLECLQEANDYLVSGEERYVESEVYRVEGLLREALAPGSGVARSYLSSAIETARASGSLGLELRAALDLAMLNRAGERFTESRRLLESIVNKFPAQSQYFDLDRARQLIAQAGAPPIES